LLENALGTKEKNKIFYKEEISRKLIEFDNNKEMKKNKWRERFYKPKPVEIKVAPNIYKDCVFVQKPIDNFKKLKPNLKRTELNINNNLSLNTLTTKQTTQKAALSEEKLLRIKLIKEENLKRSVDNSAIDFGNYLLRNKHIIYLNDKWINYKNQSFGYNSGKYKLPFLNELVKHE